MVSSGFISTAFVFILLSVGSNAASTRRLKQEVSPSPPTASAGVSVSFVESSPTPPSISISLSAVTSPVDTPADTTPPPASPTDPVTSPADPPADATPPPASPTDPVTSPADPPADATPPPASPTDPVTSPADPPADATPPPASPTDPVTSPADPPADATPPPASPTDPVTSPADPPADATPPPASPTDPVTSPADPPADATPPPASPTDPVTSPADPPADATPPPASPTDPVTSPADPPADATPPPASPTDPVTSPAEPPADATPPPASPTDPVTSPLMCRPELCSAAQRRDESVVRSAIEDGEAGLCDCVCDPTTGDTLLHVSACSEAVAFAILLLEPPPMCDADVMDADGGSPLHEAAGCCNAPMAFNFLRFGADTEKLNAAGMTPLCVAAMQNSETCAPVVVQLVSDFGANVCSPCPTDTGPMLPVDVAVNPVVKNIIIQNGGNPVDLGGTC